ncbi:two-component system VirA-like sensor kinase [Dongia sp.]|uniref:two-component system VirA-like sensor kinase n=1 Tax=Dongia sp. TaxID=1977262 RepID=UPI0035AF53B4
MLLLALLTWLALSGTNADTDRTRFAVSELDRFTATESALHRDVLLARSGMLRNYDTLVSEITTLYAIVDHLSALGPMDPVYRAELLQLREMVHQQETLTEYFKSRNAVLRNSLAYFNVFAARFREVDANPRNAHVIGGVATALLRLTIDMSAEALGELDRRLDKLRALNVAPADGSDVAAALAHALMLRNLLPATNDHLQAIFAVPTGAQVMQMRGFLSSYVEASESKANVYRYLLYGISLVLVGLIAFLAHRLQVKAMAAQRAAQIEHVIATISTRLINVPLESIDLEIERALEELAQTIGADRAYFVLANPQRIYRWRRMGVRYPAQWPDRAMTLAARLRSGGCTEILVRNRNVQTLRRNNAVRDLCSWLCIPRLADGHIDGLLAFDSVDGDFLLASTDFSLFRMARDAFTHAVERDALAQEVQRLEQIMQQARRMETIGALASGIAHNFNNIVGAILGYTEIATSYLESGREPTETLAEIRRAGERARDLVHQILTFGRGMVGETRDVDLITLLEETVSLLGAASSCRFVSEIKVERDDIVVSGLAEQLQQVILNVCNNAAQAMENTGEVRIEVDLRKVEVPIQLSHATCCPGSYAVIAVIDSGRGIDAAALKHIFDPFFTTRAEGNGLGLATVLEIVRGHAGGLNVRSSPGKGTHFEIWLPCHPSAHDSSRKQLHVPSPRGSGESILLFDPNRTRLLHNEEIVAALGFEPIGFSEPGAAYGACLGDPARFDALILCHQHGANTALDLACELKRLPGMGPIVFATPSSSDYAARVLAAAGISEIVHSPLNSAELSTVLARCLDHARHPKGLLTAAGT